MLRDNDRKDLRKIEETHFAQPAKVILDADSTISYGARVDTEAYANAAFALLNPTTENLKQVAQALQDQHRKMLYIIEQYDKTVSEFYSWLRWAEVWLVHKDEATKAIVAKESQR